MATFQGAISFPRITRLSMLSPRSFATTSHIVTGASSGRPRSSAWCHQHRSLLLHHPRTPRITCSGRRYYSDQEPMKIEVDRTVGDFPLRGKVCLVTGGGSGISLAFVRKALGADAKVLIADLKLTPEAQTLVDSSPNTVAFQETDVTNWADLESLVSTSVDKFGTVPDVYIAGAGVFEPPVSNFWTDTETDANGYLSIDVNVNHVLKLARIALRSLSGADKKGCFLSIASAAGLKPFYGTPLYTATKFAVVGFTRSMTLADALEGVKVTTICPGAVDTPLWTADKRSALQFDKLPGTPVEAVAEAMVALVTEGRYAGGTVLAINNIPGQGVVVRPDEMDLGPLMPKIKAGEELGRGLAPAKQAMDKERGKDKK